MQDQAAMRAAVPAFRKLLRYGYAAATAFLAGSRGIYFDNQGTGAFSLVLQGRDESAPGDVTDRPAQPAVPHHPTDVEAFHRDKAVAFYQRKSFLMTMISSFVSDLGVQPVDTGSSLLSVGAALFLSREGSLCPAQGCDLAFKIAGVRNMLAIARGQERLNPHVQTDCRQGAVLACDVRQKTADLGEPFPGVMGDQQGPNLRIFRQWPVELDPDRSDMLNTELYSKEPDPVSVDREFDAVEPVGCLEPGISGLFAGFDTHEERLERLVEPAHGALSGAEVEPSEPGIGGPLFLEPGRLFPVPDAPLFRLVGSLPLGEANVIEAPVGFQHDAKFPLLVPVRPESVFEGTQHLSALLALDVIPDGLFTDATDCSGIVASGPEGGKPGLKVREFRSQYSRTCALQAVHDFSHGPAGIRFDKEVDVIRHDLVNVDRGINF